MGGAEWSPAAGSMDPLDGVAMEDMGDGKKHGELSLEKSGEPGAPSTTMR